MMNVLRYKLFTGTIFCLFGCLVLGLDPPRAAAQDLVFDQIRVVGNSNLSQGHIISILGLVPNNPYIPDDLNKALRRLFDTKKFAYLELRDVLTEQGRILEVRVEEYPLVEEVKFAGNDKFDDTELEEAVHVSKGVFARPSSVRRAVREIESMYQEKGYYGVEVTHKFEPSPGTRGSVLVFGIIEGEKVSIKHIDFFGNMQVGSDDLRRVLESKEDKWYRGADFKPQQLEEDLERVVEFYKSRGFLEAEVLSHDLRFSNEGRFLDIFIYVNEGPQYFVGKIDWTGNSVVSDGAIRSQVTLFPKRVFDESAFQTMIVGINNLYWERGYIYSQINAPRKIHRNNVIDVSLEISEGKPAKIKEIKITGNTKTHENVIRRVLTVRPGQTFSNENVRRSLMEVFRLGYFAGPPQPDVQPADSEGDINLVLKVEEKQTGRFNFGAGFSALNKITGFFSMSETNFLGRGQTIGLNWEFSRTRKNFSVNYAQPWLFGTPTHFGITIFNQTQARVSQQFYDDRRQGFTVQLGRPVPWWDFTRAYLNFRYQTIELTNFDPLYTGTLRDTQWPQQTNEIGISLVRDSGNHPQFPSAGSRSSITAEFAGGFLGGDVEFHKYRAAVAFYNELFRTFRLRLSTQFGLIDNFSGTEDVPDFEKFRLGGNRLNGVRGYDFFEIVPRGNPPFVGGRFMNINTLELIWPLSDQIYVLGFIDLGNTWNSFQTSDFSDMRRGAGPGIRVEIPMLGLLGFDYGYGFDKTGGGDWEPHLSVGGLF